MLIECTDLGSLNATKARRTTAGQFLTEKSTSMLNQDKILIL